MYMTYEEFNKSFYDKADEICLEMFGVLWEDINSNEEVILEHAKAGAWISYKLQQGDLK